MRRRRFTILASLAFALCIAFAAVWARSCFYSDQINLRIGKIHGRCYSFLGRLQFSVESYNDPTEPYFYWTETPEKIIDMVSFGPLFQFKVGGSSYVGLIPIQPLLRINFPAPAALAASVVLLFVCLRTRAGKAAGI